MARRRSSEQEPVEVVAPAELGRCVVEDWISPDDDEILNPPAWRWAGTVTNDNPTATEVQQFAQLRAWKRHRDALQAFETEYGVMLPRSQPHFRDAQAFYDRLLSLGFRA